MMPPIPGKRHNTAEIALTSAPTAWAASSRASRSYIRKVWPKAAYHLASLSNSWPPIRRATLAYTRKKARCCPALMRTSCSLIPTATWTMGQANSHSNNDWHAYEGIEITGRIRQVYSRGELIIDGDAVSG